MAINYSVAQATKIIAEGTDKAAIMDITRRFPLMAMSIKEIVTKAGDSFVEFTANFPDYLTCNKVNKTMKLDIEDDDEEETSEPDSEPEEKKAPKKAKAAKKAEEEDEEESEEEDYDEMSEVELFKLCKKKGLKAAPKKTKKYYINMLKKADAAEEEDEEEKTEKKAPKKASKKAAKKVEPDEEEDEDEDDEDWDI